MKYYSIPGMKIIDTHIHLFDTTRPQGVPYPNRDNAVLWKPALPSRYRALATPVEVVGAIAVEASPWLEDNLWLLEACSQDRLLVGAVGNLEPEKPEFRDYLDRFARNPLFRGIRYGNLWGRSLRQAAETHAFIDGLNHLQQANLSLDTANPDEELLEAVLRISDKVPGLRIIIDHLPHALGKMKETALLEFAARKQIYAKVSEVPLAGYKPILDRMWESFGEDRLLFGSDWPNWDTVSPLSAVVKLASDYVIPKGPVVAQKFFYANSIQAYRWQ